jgi:hypothetical protein
MLRRRRSDNGFSTTVTITTTAGDVVTVYRTPAFGAGWGTNGRPIMLPAYVILPKTLPPAQKLDRWAELGKAITLAAKVAKELNQAMGFNNILWPAE